ncbi:hypothetical protein CR513_11090, partial [Mucuna pruriens]
ILNYFNLHRQKVARLFTLEFSDYALVWCVGLENREKWEALKNAIEALPRVKKYRGVSQGDGNELGKSLNKGE